LGVVLKWETITAVVTEHYILYEFKPNSFFPIQSTLYLFVYVYFMAQKRKRTWNM